MTHTELSTLDQIVKQKGCNEIDCYYCPFAKFYSVPNEQTIYCNISSHEDYDKVFIIDGALPMAESILVIATKLLNKWKMRRLLELSK